MSKEEFVDVVSKYDGEIKEADNTVFFIDVHNIRGRKNIKVVFKLYESGVLSGYEETYSIVGGFSFPDADVEELIKRLEFYEFNKKAYEQLRLF